MTTLNISSNLKANIAKLEYLNKGIKNKMFAAGLKRIGATVKTQAKREITEAYNVRSGEVAKRLAVSIKAAESVTLTVSAIRKTARLPLDAFKPRQTKKGIVVTIKKANGKKLFPKAFKITTKAGKELTLMRNSDGKLERIRTIDLTQMFSSKKIQSRMREHALTKGEQILSSAINEGIRRAGL